MRKYLAAAAFGCLVAPSAWSAVTSVNLGNYQLSSTYTLNLALNNNEASALTWNPDTNRLYTVEDEGGFIYELGLDGSLISSMSMTGFADTESLAYIGGGQFVVGEERLQDVYRFTYSAGGTLSRGALPFASLGPTVGNVGIEGITYDPVHNTYIFVKEKTPQRVGEASIAFTGDSPAVTDLGLPAWSGLLDLSDVLSFASLPSMAGTADQDNLLVLSQESQLLLEVARDGSVLSFYNLAALGTRIEGVAMDADGNIYLTNEGVTLNDSAKDNIPAESARLMVLSPTPVPLPAAAWMLMSGLGALGVVGRRKRNPAAGA